MKTKYAKQIRRGIMDAKKDIEYMERSGATMNVTFGNSLDARAYAHTLFNSKYVNINDWKKHYA